MSGISTWQKYGIWSLLVHEISILANLNTVYIHVLSRYCYCENEQLTKHYFFISAWIPNIKEEKRKNINVRICFTSYLN